jgi:hypothetical protein
LSRLEIKGVNFDPYWFETAISRPEFSKISQLVINGQKSGVEGPSSAELRGWRQYDFERMSQAFEDYLPDLEALDWSPYATSSHARFLPLW